VAALDSCARKDELCGLRWTNVDLESATIRVARQLTKRGPELTFGPPKNGTARTVTLSADTIELLRTHNREQAALKMATRTTYKDLGLVFAKEYGDLTNRADLIGLPLQANNLGERQFSRLIKAAKVNRITFHGMRHTTAHAAAPGRRASPRGLEAAWACARGDHAQHLRTRSAGHAAAGCRDDGSGAASVVTY